MIYLEETNIKVIIDRFEGQYAVCEKDDKSMIDIERTRIPVSAKEGDVLKILGDTITIDKAETDIRKKEVENLTKSLWN